MRISFSLINYDNVIEYMYTRVDKASKSSEKVEKRTYFSIFQLTIILTQSRIVENVYK